MGTDDLEMTIDDLIGGIRLASIELYGRGNIEALCQVFGGILHGIVCSDETMPEETKASYISFTIGLHLTGAAIDHFPREDIDERLKAILDARKVRWLH